MRAHLQVTRLLVPLVIAFAVVAPHARAAGPDLGPGSRATLREAAASPRLQAWQRRYMLQIAADSTGDSPGPPPDSVGSDYIPGIPFTPEGAWTVVPPDPAPTLPPAPRVTPTGAYDSVRRRMIVFGGSGAVMFNDVWALNLDHPFAWTQLAPTGSPPAPRRLHGAIYDPVRDRMIVFGGFDGTFFDDTWSLQFSGPTNASWTQLAPLGSPPFPRADFAMIYDPVGDRALVFGGFDGVSPTNFRRDDLWQLSLAGTPQWTQLAPGSGPTARSGHRGAYDSLRQRMIVYGGLDVGFLSDTWALSLSGPLAWTMLTPPGGVPPARVEHSVSYDPGSDRLVIYGGYDDLNASSVRGDAWALPLGVPSGWTLLSAVGPPLWGSAVVHDPDRRELVVFGGREFSLSLDTYTLDIDGLPEWWYHPRPQPGVITPSAVYDPIRQRMVVFGGADNVYKNEVWVVGLGPTPGWQQLFPTGTPPPPRRLHCAVFDQAADRMIIFGGFDDTNRNDTWALNFSGATGASWTPILPAGPLPPGRSDFGMVFDPIARRLVAFGGYDGVSPPAQRRGDLWTLNLNGTPTWTEINLPGAPTPRSGHRAIYDSKRHRMVLFGGYDVMMLSDTYALTLGGSPAWSAINPGGALPAPRADHAVAYDSRRDRLVLHAGYDGFGSFGDTWVLPLANPASWSDITPLDSPLERWGCAGIYDWLFDRFVVWGGSDYDRRALALNWDSPTPTQLALQSVEARPGLVRLVWHGLDSRGAAATVYRRENGADWRVRGAVESDASGRMVWEDREVVAGVRYEYRLGLLEDGQEVFTGATSVIVPAGVELAVRAISPAISAGRLALWCSAPAPGRARLEVVDVAGRRIAARDLDLATAGGMEVVIDPSPRAGLYFARLSQDGRSARAKVSVIH